MSLFITILIILDISHLLNKLIDCRFRRLSRKALGTEQSIIKIIDVPTIEICERTCGHDISCKSVAFCHKGTNENKCYLNSLELNEAYPQYPSDEDCISSFDPCVEGKKECIASKVRDFRL